MTARSVDSLRSPLGRPPIMLDIVEEHFEELDFLWQLRERVLFAPDWTLDDLEGLEERAEAHLDGLRLAELHGVEVARPALSGKHTFAATAATLLFMDAGDPELSNEVVTALESAKPPARDGIRIGLRHSRIDAVSASLAELASKGQSGLRAAATDVLAFHGGTVRDLRDLLNDDDDRVRILGYGAVGRGDSALDPELVVQGLRSKSPTVRRAVLEAGARSAIPGLEAICVDAATRPIDPDLEALAFLGVLGGARSLEILRDSLRRPELSRSAIRGIGALGRVETVEALLQAMEDPGLASAAGAAFQRITGAENIRGVRLEPAHAAHAAGEDLEAELGDDPTPPDPARARAWWALHRSDLQPSGRCQAGRQIGPSPLVQGFHSLPLESRRDLYLGALAAGATSLRDLRLEQCAAVQRTVKLGPA